MQEAKKSNFGIKLALDLVAPTVGEAWLLAMEAVLEHGSNVDDYQEVLNLAVCMTKPMLPDPILDRAALPEHIEEMRKVFHSSEPNRFGHSYRERMLGPTTGDPIGSVVDALSRQPSTRRAVITLVGRGNGEVPCLNVIQFMERGGRLLVSYFARGQDIFNKFYADATCILDLADAVGKNLKLSLGVLHATIASAHIYTADVEKARDLLAGERGARP